MEKQRLTEFGINRHIYPIIQKRGRVFEYPHYRTDSKGDVVFEASKESRWNLRCYKFMDYIASKMRHNFDSMICMMYPNGGIIKSVTDYRLENMVLLTRPDMLRDIIDGLNNPFSQFCNISRAYEANPILKIKSIAKDLNWKKEEVISIIKMISNYKFKTKYHFKTSKEYGETITTNYDRFYCNMEDHKNREPIFNCRFNKDNTECQLNFNTGFGVCFIHNIFVGGYQLYDDNLYNLSESAQIVYRKKFLTYSRLPKVNFNIDSVCKILGITSPNVTIRKKLFENVVAELLRKTDIQLVQKVDNLNYVLSLGIKKASKVVNMTTYSSDRIKDFLG